MPVSQSKLARLTPNLGILWISVCSFCLGGSIVTNPIIYRLVLSPSRYEIRQLHCIALQCISVHCIVVQCIVLNGIVLYCIVLHGIVLYCIARVIFEHLTSYLLCKGSPSYLILISRVYSSLSCLPLLPLYRWFVLCPLHFFLYGFHPIHLIFFCVIIC